MYEIAFARISDFFGDLDSPFVGFCTPPEIASSKARNLAFMLLRYRFSMTLCAARLAALRPFGWDEPVESLDRVRVTFWVGGCVGIGSAWSCGAISGFDEMVDTEPRLLCALSRRNGGISMVRD